jgi:hypothetical protein
MSIPHETTKEELEGLFDENGNINGTRSNGRFAPDPTPRERTGGSETVTREQCARWRRSVRRPSGTMSAIAERVGVNISTVRYHVRDACSHEVDEPRMTGDQR